MHKVTFIFLIVHLITFSKNLSGQNIYFSDSVFSVQIAKWYNFKEAAYTATFDDGSYNQFHLARPFLDSLDIKATFFPICFRIDSGTWGNNWNDIISTANAGHEIGSHTVYHTNLLKDKKSLQIFEINQSKTKIETHIPGYKCLSFSYPFSSYDDSIDGLVKETYIAARAMSNKMRFNSQDFDKYQCQSYAISSVYRTRGLNLNIDTCIMKGNWFIETYHGLDNKTGNDKEGNNPLDYITFQQHLKYIKSKDSRLWIAPLINVIKYIELRNNTTVNFLVSNDSILKVSFVSSIKTELYNQPLSICVIMSDNFSGSEVYANDTLIASNHVTYFSHRKKFIYFEIIPDRNSNNKSTKVENIIEIRKSKYLSVDNTKNDSIIFQNYPNPFSNETVINYIIPSGIVGDLRIEVYNNSGELILSRSHNIYQKGSYIEEIDFHKYKKGIYYCKLAINNYRKCIKIIFI